MPDYANRTIEQMTFNIGKQDEYAFGPNLNVVDSTFVIDSDFRGLSVSDVTFSNCKFHIKKLSNFRWCRARVVGCEFRGRLVGHDFGNWPEAYVVNGSVQNTNFENAILDGVRFIRCDMTKIRLPKWPCFSILNPKERVEELRSKDPSAELGFIWVDGIPENPDFTTCITWYAPALAKACKVSERDLKSYLSKFSFIQM